MKKGILTIVSSLLLVTMLANTVFAKPFDPNDYTSVNIESEFLPRGVKQDKASEYAIRRGDYFIRADLLISNKGDGNIGALAIAYLEVPVDEVYISIYLDRWDDVDRRWRQVTYYDAEFFAKDYPDGLSTPEVNITFAKQPMGQYYRLRSAFAAYKDGSVEGFSPSTAGLLVD